MSAETPHPVFAAQPQYVVMPSQAKNGLGVFGFLLAFFGLFVPTGIVAFLGFLVSLAAIGRSPRGFATAGVIFGLIGSLIWLVIDIIAILGLLAAAVFGAVMISAGVLMTRPEMVEITTDMANTAIAIVEYEDEHDALPSDLAALGLSRAMSIDPWGVQYQMLTSIETGHNDLDFEILSAGPDSEFGTDDDIALSSLGDYIESQFENIDDDLERFGNRMERLERHNKRSHSCAFSMTVSTDRDECHVNNYEAAARAAIAEDD